MSRSGLAILPLGVLLTAALAHAEEADPCAALQPAVTMAPPAVAGRAVSTHGTWTAAAGSPGVMLEIRSDSDRLASYTYLGAGGAWSWEVKSYRVSIELCQKHSLRVDVFPLLRQGEALTHCLEHATSVKDYFTIDCSTRASIDSCQWTCAADAPGGALCHGKCSGSGSGLGDQFLSQWSVDQAVVATADTASAGPWVQEIECRPGQQVTLTVRPPRGLKRVSPPVSVVCGQP